MEVALEVKLHEIPKYVSTLGERTSRKWFRYANSWQNNTFTEFVTLGSNLWHLLLQQYFSRMLTDINEWIHVALISYINMGCASFNVSKLYAWSFEGWVRGRGCTCTLARGQRYTSFVCSARISRTDTVKFWLGQEPWNYPPKNKALKLRCHFWSYN